MKKNVITFGADMSSPVRINTKNEDILILGEGLTQGLHDTTLIAKAKYPINFTQSGKWLVLSLHYNGSKSLLLVNDTKMYQFKVKDFEIRLCSHEIRSPLSICS